LLACQVVKKRSAYSATNEFRDDDDGDEKRQNVDLEFELSCLPDVKETVITSDDEEELDNSGVCRTALRNRKRQRTRRRKKVRIRH